VALVSLIERGLAWVGKAAVEVDAKVVVVLFDY
jgi:hypothetical protein